MISQGLEKDSTWYNQYGFTEGETSKLASFTGYKVVFCRG